MIYLWQAYQINTSAKVSKDSGTFAEITANSHGAQSLGSAGLYTDGQYIKTINYTVPINSEGATSLGNGIAFYFNKTDPNRIEGNMPLLLRVKDTTKGYYGQWYTYGTCVRAYNVRSGF